MSERLTIKILKRFCYASMNHARNDLGPTKLRYITLTADRSGGGTAVQGLSGFERGDKAADGPAGYSYPITPLEPSP
ncbi:hypothetical protein SKAU_G00089110 [Synaphobranchus kaupii]|uniref:Uncharacterized protein n=1 Tax=Synaphobranchus kaupii TaxID=118154 RepID=A0A9Q1J6B4_SYNKA|nr:hypothetical protein SKAU_G00089110 [Synaphobranchus kaupii]